MALKNIPEANGKIYFYLFLPTLELLITSLIIEREMIGDTDLKLNISCFAMQTRNHCVLLIISKVVLI